MSEQTSPEGSKRHEASSSESTKRPGETPSTVKSHRRAPFQLYFPVKCEIGKTPLKGAEVGVLASKFYSRYEREILFEEEVIQACMERLKPKDVKKIYLKPNTENQRYGWYKMDVDRLDKVVRFAKNTNQLIEEHFMNYAKIRE